jgi:hypothetical protein
MEHDQNNVNLRYLVPVVVSDGNVVVIDDKDVPTLLFFQAREQHEGHVHGDIVAAVRLNNVDDLSTLQKAIDETVKKHKQREP